MRVLILGAGAVGSLFGARLALAGNEVTLVSRGPHLEAIRSRGLEVTGMLNGRLALAASDRIPSGSAPEAVLLTAKAYDIESLAAELAHQESPTLTVALQNGLGIPELLFSGLKRGGWTQPSDWGTVGINSIPATLVRPGVVRQAGEGEVLLPGPTSDPLPPVDLKRLVPALRESGIPSRQVEDFDREVWKKLLVNAAINPVTADHGVVNGKLVDDPWRRQALELLEEARSVAAAEGIRIPAEEAEADLWRVVRATATNRSSMLQDVDRGRRTEIDAISGELVRRGAQHGLALPATQRALDRIRRKTARAVS